MTCIDRIACRAADLALAPLHKMRSQWLKAKAAIGKAAAPLGSALPPVQRRLAPVTARLAPLWARLAPLWERLAPLRERLAAGRAGVAALRPHLPVLAVAVFLGLFVTLLSVPRASALVLVMVVLTAMAACVYLLYAGMHGKSWAITLSFVLVAFTIDATARRRGDMADSGMDAQTLFKLMLWGGAFLIGTLNFSRIKAALQESVALRWMFAFALWSLASTLYSITPTYTFGGGFGHLALLCFTAVMVQTVGMDKLRLAFIYACGLLTTSAVALYFVAPGMAVAQLEGGTIARLAGLTGSPNNLGRCAAIALFFVFFAVRDKQVRLMRPDIALIAFSSLAALILSWSRTSLLGVVLAIGIVLVRKRVMLLLAGGVAASGTFLLMLMANVDFDRVVRLVSRQGSLSELTTLTGRTSIWHYVWGAIEKAPFLGYGYGSTKLLIPMGFRTIYGWTTTSAHNMFLQALVTTGLVGAIFIVGAVLTQLRDFFKRPHDMADAAFVFVLISGFSEAGAVGVAPNLLTIFWLVSLVVPRKAPSLEKVPVPAPLPHAAPQLAHWCRP